MVAKHPERIICLTEETTETLYLLGEQDRIVGISGYTVRPPEARKEKPRVSGFINAKTDKILGLKPDLVLGFSDLQAEIASTLIREGISVYVFNQRSVQGILDMILTLGSMIGVQDKANTLIQTLNEQIESVKTKAQKYKSQPKVYFEEWDDPMISGVHWVSQLIHIAGGVDCFSELAPEGHAKNRIVTTGDQVIKRNPDIIVASWCGKKFKPEAMEKRAGWDKISAVQRNHLYEIKSAYILQPGPAAITEGLVQLETIISNWQTT